LTNFRFAISTDVKGSELVRFNQYFIHSKSEEQLLRNHIEDLRTHCSKVQRHAEKISGSANATGFRKIFELLGLHSPKREKMLGMLLGVLTDREYGFADSAIIMLNCLEEALKDIQNTLGIAGSMHPEKIPDACTLLAEYGPHFSEMEVRAAVALYDIQKLIDELE